MTDKEKSDIWLRISKACILLTIIIFVCLYSISVEVSIFRPEILENMANEPMLEFLAIGIIISLSLSCIVGMLAVTMSLIYFNRDDKNNDFI